ncbi:putative F-box protein At4g05475 [Bidens hawaiensis]|uniref:putative F-box protein At4g05475 n=1 Tax=Bidens hawaiensis TaxID=980011 RepID=UPI00404B8219
MAKTKLKTPKPNGFEYPKIKVMVFGLVLSQKHTEPHHAHTYSFQHISDLFGLAFINRSSQLRRLEVIQYDPNDCEIWSKAFKKLPLLEELSLIDTSIWKEDIEVAGRCCSLLKTLKLNQQADKMSDTLWVEVSDDDDEEEIVTMNELALAIGKSLPELTHLELIGNYMTNTGLRAILDGCCHLELLDLRRCSYVNLKGALGKRCLQQIEYLKLPRDSLKGCRYNNYVLDDWDSEYDGNLDSESDVDDFANLSFESLHEMMAFEAIFY